MVAAVVCLFLPELGSRGEEPKSDLDKVSALMRIKLEHSQKVREGITTQDFKMISSNARRLKSPSARRPVRGGQDDPLRDAQQRHRREAEDLIKAAKEKNVDAAALAYVDMTLTCVQVSQASARSA